MAHSFQPDSADEMAALRRIAELENQLLARQTHGQQPGLRQTGSGGIAQGAGAKAAGTGSVVADQVHAQRDRGATV